MRVEIIELLRCPVSHELTPLVAIADVRQGDQLINATLGCPVCHAEFFVRNGVAQLVVGEPPGATAEPRVRPDAQRMAALLNLVEPGRRIALCGDAAGAAAEIGATTDASCVVFNARDGDSDDARSSYIRTEATARVPLADASLDALAVDHRHVHWLLDSARVVRTGGRVLAPAHAPVPDGCTELARDATEWIGEISGALSAPVMLRRASSHSREPS